ncbi:Asp23/Gls24 family envelope stress response protein [Anaerosolibacter sp.]|uniref:Asp23/Gls24 family envelope stress response protein n=1 Tax=Anaerosolibacter sp. TaxID=1872527 RepID=UPI0039F0E64E
MKVVALVGESGTGKSYRAITLSHEKDLDCIIDDGLLVQKNKIIAGKSAKRESTAVGAVKRALFHDDGHRDLVKQAIHERNVQGILILGTSERMVNKIAQRLGISPIQEYVYIEDISTEEERKAAKKQRRDLGKHVIPVPTFEIKQDFSGYFIDPLKILRRRKDNTIDVSEKSVVRPTFSYMGRYTISDKVISDLVAHAALKIIGVSKVARIDVVTGPDGVVITMDAIMVYGNPLRALAKQIQQQVKKEVEYMTALNILSINITVKSLVVLS